MAQDRAKLLLQQGITAAKAGQKTEAFQILQQAVKLDPRNETIWLWLSSVARNDQERAFCLKQLLAINPQNEMAIKGLKALGIEAEQAKQQAATTPATSVPSVSQEKLAALQPALDELLRTYKPALYTPLEIEWIHKDRRRYGEGAARRLRTSVYVAGAIGVVAVLVLVGVLLAAVLGGEQARQEARRRTIAPTFTPSITFTPTQIVNTPLPPGIGIPTPVPPQAGIPRGNAQFNPTATFPYPSYSVSIRGEILNIVRAFNSGNYESARTQAEEIRTSQQRVCYQDAYYYEALSLANLGGRSRLDQAEQLLAEGINARRDPGFENTCQESNLLRAGMCYVKYQKGILDPANLDRVQLAQAIDFCSRAVDNDPQLIQAAQTLAQVYLALGDNASLNNAFSVLDETLNARPVNRGNTILLLALADVEMARGRYEQALVYLETALYVDPVLETALQKRVEAHLRIAAQEPPGERQIIRYGIAATFAEYYLFYYPGAPQGNVLLAEARLREGNPDRALDILNRIISAEDELAPTARDVVQRAYSLRLEIYTARRDWQNAYNDLEQLRVFAPNNPDWARQQVELALELERYGEALAGIEALREDDPFAPDLVLLQARIVGRICRYGEGLECDYRLVARELLTDEYINALPTASPQRLEAESIRLEADFALLIERKNEILPDDEEANARYIADLEVLRDRLLTLVAMQQTGENYYLLGRIYDELSQPRLAVGAYEWVVYWHSFYAYPFGDDASDALEAAREQAAEAEVPVEDS